MGGAQLCKVELMPALIHVCYFTGQIKVLMGKKKKKNCSPICRSFFLINMCRSLQVGVGGAPVE